MKSLRLILSLFFIITACSTGNKIPPSASVVPPEALVDDSVERPKSDAPKPLDPEAGKASATTRPAPYLVSPLYMSPLNGDAAAVAMALAGTAIGLSQIFRTAEVTTDLNGRCVYGTPDAPIVSPCINVKVNLLDERQKILSSSTTNRSGDFRFYIPNQQTFFVQVVDRKGRQANTKVQVGRSDYVSLYLKP